MALALDKPLKMSEPFLPGGFAHIPSPPGQRLQSAGSLISEAPSLAELSLI